MGSDVRIVPTHTTITAEDLAILFFNHWYCENGLPADIVCDRDKLFVSRFWKALTKLTGVKLKMRRNQKGWLAALPRIRFQIMNTVNTSTGFSGFQLHLGRSPRLIPTLTTSHLPPDLLPTTETALEFLNRITLDTAEAADNLLQAKINQAHHASVNRGPDPHYAVDDLVMLSTTHQRHEYKRKGERRVAKFFPRWDGPYRITDVHSETSNYTLDIPTNAYPVYHVSELKKHHANDHDLFPSRELTKPAPVLTTDGLEYLVDEIVDVRRRGRGWQFLVHWSGYGREHDLWLPASELTDCEALDLWYKNGGDGPDKR